jgi:hypothetical protein
MADKKSSTAKPTTADKKPAQGKAKAKPKSATRELGEAELEKVSGGNQPFMPGQGPGKTSQSATRPGPEGLMTDLEDGI